MSACGVRWFPMAMLVFCLPACEGGGNAPAPTLTANPAYLATSFSDDARTNVQVDADDLDLNFIDTKGQQFRIKQYQGKKNLVLVFTRGFYGQLCPYCMAQASRFISSYAEFSQRDAEILVVFPGARDHVDDFMRAAEAQSDPVATSVPFPILLDEEFAAVDKLGIRDNLAKPSVYILDKQGQVRFAYVGKHLGDRPSLKAILRELDSLAAEAAASEIAPK